MKKILYISIFMLCALLMVACDNDDYPFSLEIDNVSKLRESIVYDLTLNDEDDLLKNSEVKGQISEKGSSTVLSTKDVSFSASSKTATVEFKNLTADTKYTVVFYVGYDGKKVELYNSDKDETQALKTSAQGTVEDPYSIDSYDDFTNIVKKDPSGHFKLVNDIDFNGKSISPLFTSSKPFTGTFDGNSKTISNFKLSATDSETSQPTHSAQSSQYYGLFGYIGADGKVSKLTLDSFDIMIKRSTDSESHYGLLAGYCAGEVTNVNVTNSKLNVKSEKTAKDKFNVGGLIGKLTSTGKVSNVSVKAEITVYGAIDVTVGGVVANTANAVIIEKTTDTGVEFVPNIYNAKYEGNIVVSLSGSAGSDAQTSIGGVLGNNYSAIVDACDSKGKISLTSDFTTVGNQGLTLGGVVGKNQNPNSRITNSTSSIDFYLNTTDAPSKAAEDKKDEQKVLKINVGLVVGINKGIVNSCSYTKPDTTTYEIHVNNSEFVESTVGVIAQNKNNSSQVRDNVSNSAVTFVKVLYKYDNNAYVEESRVNFDTIADVE